MNVPTNISTATFERLNPVTGEVASSAAALGPAQVPAIAAKAHTAFLEWRKSSPVQRRDALLKACEALEARAEAFIAAMVSEIGATPAWAGFNVHVAVEHIKEAAAMTSQITGDVLPSNYGGRISLAVREPIGVMLGIAPWNAPIILGVRTIAFPLACGNSVILKASEQCPETHRLIVEAFEEAGLPEGTVNLVTNAPEHAGDVVGALIDAPEVKRINFTGSTNVGRIIAKRAAEHLKPCLLELGGKAPFVVLEDADLDEAVAAAAFGAFMNQGQICMSTERIIVVDEVADAFVEKLTQKVAAYTVNDPKAGDSVLGAVVNANTVEHCQALIKDAVDSGAKLLLGGETSRNVLMPAHLVDHVTDEMKLFRDESFGPVVGVIRARDEAHAIKLANDTEYGLSSSVFTRDIARGMRIASEIEAGICHINAATVSDEPNAPFGGVKASGYGRFNGRAGIDAFSELRWVTFETQPGHYPI